MMINGDKGIKDCFFLCMHSSVLSQESSVNPSFNLWSSFFFFFRVSPFDYVPTVAGLASNTNLCLLTLVRPLNQGWSSIPGGQAWKLTPTSKLVQSQLLSVITIHCLLSNGTKVLFHNFLGSTVVKNLPANAGGHRFDPWEDSTFHGATEPMCCNYWSLSLETIFCNQRSHCNEKSVHSKKD